MEKLRISKSFRLPHDTDRMLKELSQKLDLPENQVVNLAIRHFHQEQVYRKTEKLLEEKKKLLEEKDKLIAKLTKQLLELQEQQLLKAQKKKKAK